MKATHNGTCQCCGRQQAAKPYTHSIAKHGYTKKHHFFSGTCHGSDFPALERSDVELQKMVKHLREVAAVRAAMTIDSDFLTPVRLVYRGAWEPATVRSFRTEAELRADPDFKESLLDGYQNSWARRRARQLDTLQFQGREMAEHAKMLLVLRESRFGKPLLPRLKVSAS